VHAEEGVAVVLRQRACHFTRRARSRGRLPLLQVAACAPTAIPASFGCTYEAHDLSLFWCAYHSPRRASSFLFWTGLWFTVFSGGGYMSVLLFRGATPSPLCWQRFLTRDMTMTVCWLAWCTSGFFSCSPCGLQYPTMSSLLW